jgi:signal transduction histidine kinase
MLAQVRGAARIDPLDAIATNPWWPAAASTGPVGEIIGRLWRYSVTVSIAARRLAREAGDPAPEAVARAGLLCRLGCWAIAAVGAEWLVRWSQADGPSGQRLLETADLGSDLDTLGRRLAERWGCDPLVIDAAWLHGDHGPSLKQAASDPDRLAFIQEACGFADLTPWALADRPSREAKPIEPRFRILVAEVQARCTSAFVASDATSHEERMTRENARLRQLMAAERQGRARGDRFLRALADSDPAESAEDWAARAAITWCAEPEVSAARVVWLDAVTPTEAQSGETAAPAEDDRSSAPSWEQRTPTVALPLEVQGRVRAYVHLWSDRDRSELECRLSEAMPRGAWESWAGLVSDRAKLEHRLQSVVEAFRQTVDTEELRLQESKRAALSEFAAGAGHELNNPLAVIVGRAQLLLARTDDPETAKSLRIMISQAGRAHRILRDLMFVARPPAPRRRTCRPSELLRSCLRDHSEECATRGIRLTSEIDESIPAAWTDPDGLRHLADILIRNAIQATPAGGNVQVRSCLQGHELLWSFSDTGKGMTASDAAHLFDPFYCGRRAGRGLGLGLPRAARIVDLAGGRLRWSSNPGQGTVFQIHLPLKPGPDHEDHPVAPSAPSQPDGLRR